MQNVMSDHMVFDVGQGFREVCTSASLQSSFDSRRKW